MNDARASIIGYGRRSAKSVEWLINTVPRGYPRQARHIQANRRTNAIGVRLNNTFRANRGNRGNRPADSATPWHGQCWPGPQPDDGADRRWNPSSRFRWSRWLPSLRETASPTICTMCGGDCAAECRPSGAGTRADWRTTSLIRGGEAAEALHRHARPGPSAAVGN